MHISCVPVLLYEAYNMYNKNSTLGWDCTPHSELENILWFTFSFSCDLENWSRSSKLIISGVDHHAALRVNQHPKTSSIRVFTKPTHKPLISLNYMSKFIQSIFCTNDLVCCTHVNTIEFEPSWLVYLTFWHHCDLESMFRQV